MRTRLYITVDALDEPVAELTNMGSMVTLALHGEDRRQDVVLTMTDSKALAIADALRNAVSPQQQTGASAPAGDRE